MAIGARKAFQELPSENEQEQWLGIPYLGSTVFRTPGNPGCAAASWRPLSLLPPTRARRLRCSSMRCKIQEVLPSALALWQFPCLLSKPSVRGRMSPAQMSLLGFFRRIMPLNSFVHSLSDLGGLFMPSMQADPPKSETILDRRQFLASGVRRARCCRSCHSSHWVLFPGNFRKAFLLSGAPQISS